MRECALVERAGTHGKKFRNPAYTGVGWNVAQAPFPRPTDVKAHEAVPLARFALNKRILGLDKII
jgi:hypothetical protein